MRLPRGRRLYIALGAAALLGAVGVVAVTRPSDSKSTLAVEAAGDSATPPELGDLLPGERESSSTTLPAPSSSSTTATTLPRSTTTAPPMTTTTREACAPAAPVYAFGLVRLPDGNGWAGAANPALRRSDDGGQTWTSACLPADVRGPGSVQGIDFTDDGRHGWAVGVSGGRPVTFRTDDGGDHWTAGRLAVLPDLAGGLNDVAFAGTRLGWAVGHLSGPGPANATGGILLHTRDGGATWSSHPVPPVAGRLTRISVVDATHAWAVGTGLDGKPVIIATTDGTTWAAQTVPDGVRELRDVAFVDSQRGWAVGALPVPQPAQPGQDDPGVILTTGDGGATWTRQAETVGSLWSIDPLDARTVYAGGGHGLFSTRDGGATWTKQPFALPALDAIDFTDADHGWVTHSMFSTVCRTDDGGHSWIASDVRPAGKGTDCLP